MNRSSNVLNSSSLGSGGASKNVYIRIQQNCQAICTAAISAGRYLKATGAVAQAQTIATLRAVRFLKSTLATQAQVSARISVVHRVWLAASQTAAASVKGTLTRLRPIRLSSRETATARITATLGKRTAVALQAVQAAAAGVTAQIHRARCLMASLVVMASVHGRLSEASRQKAPLERTAEVSMEERTVHVSGEIR